MTYHVSSGTLNRLYHTILLTLSWIFADKKSHTPTGKPVRLPLVLGPPLLTVNDRLSPMLVLISDVQHVCSCSSDIECCVLLRCWYLNSTITALMRCVMMGVTSLPGPSLPGPSVPGPSNPGPSLPGPSDPRPSLPGPSVPGPSVPGPSDPGPSDP